MTRFTERAVRKHIKREHPGCPDFAVDYFTAEIINREWKDATIGQAVGITMQSIMRHLMTDYDALLLAGMDRKEARRKVQPLINAMIDSWLKATAKTDTVSHG